ncbi:MAG: hypothetical protein ACI89D_002545 [Bermanella sp.]|jgi:hypothetical protein
MTIARKNIVDTHTSGFYLHGCNICNLCRNNLLLITAPTDVSEEVFYVVWMS